MLPEAQPLLIGLSDGSRVGLVLESRPGFIGMASIQEHTTISS